MRTKIPFLEQLALCKGSSLGVHRLIGSVDDRLVNAMKHAINSGNKYPYMICTCLSSNIHGGVIRKIIHVVYVQEAHDGATCTIYGFSCKERLYQIDIDTRFSFSSPKVGIYQWDYTKLTIH